jgi:putative transposase
VLAEAHDEWQTTDRRYLAEATKALLTAPTPPQEGVATPELMTA